VLHLVRRGSDRASPGEFRRLQFSIFYFFFVERVPLDPIAGVFSFTLARSQSLFRDLLCLSEFFRRPGPPFVHPFSLIDCSASLPHSALSSRSLDLLLQPGTYSSFPWRELRANATFQNILNLPRVPARNGTTLEAHLNLNHFFLRAPLSCIFYSRERFSRAPLKLGLRGPSGSDEVVY